MAARAGKKKLGFKDITPTMPLQGVAGELYPKECFLWSQKPNEKIQHDPEAPHNLSSKKFVKGAKSKVKVEDNAEGPKEEANERDVFNAYLSFIAFGTTPAGSPNYPRLIDLDKTPKDQVPGVNAVIAYMQFHFSGVGAQGLRTQIVGK